MVSPKLDPVREGRAGLAKWLLANRSHRRAQKRIGLVYRVWGHDPFLNFVSLHTPWTVDQYPGTFRFLATLLNVSERSAEAYLKTRRGLPKMHARKLAEICEQRIIQFQQLQREFEAIAAAPSQRALKRRKRGG